MGADGWRSRYYPVGSPLASPSHLDGQYVVYTFDPQGSLVQRQAQNNGLTRALDTAAYDGYGAKLGDIDALAGGTMSYQDPVGFGGQYGYYSDVETGMQLLTHRYYDSGRGRFVTRDPTGYNGGINLYGYTGNNPVNDIDPDGTAYEPIDLALDIGAVAFDTGKLYLDHIHHASAAEISVDQTALGLDALGALPLVPPGMGRAYALAHGGIQAAHAIRALRRTRAAVKVVQGVSLAAAAGSGGGSSSGGSSNDLAKAAGDLHVGTYAQSRAGNLRTGLNGSHTPHHVVQDAVIMVRAILSIS